MTTPSPLPNQNNVFNSEEFIELNGLTKAQADNYYQSLNTLITVDNGLSLNSNIIADGKTIIPQKVGFINNLSSDVQQQINNISAGLSSTVGIIVPLNTAITNNDNLNTFANKTQGQINNLISNTPANVVDLNSAQTLTNKTLTTPKITSLKTLTNNILNVPDINDTIATNGQISTINSTISNINSDISNLNSKVDNLPVSFGSGEVYYLNANTVIVNSISYYTLTKSPPNGMNATLTQIINNTSGNVLLGSFLSDTINKTFIDAGLYEFNLFASISDLADTTKIYCVVSKLSSSFVKTNLFTLNNSLDIQSLPVILYSFQGTQPQYTINTDDKLVVDFFCNTTHNQNVTVVLYYNTSNYFSHLHIPLITTHDQLTGLNTGNYQHLTQLEKNNIINESSVSNNGYLSSVNFQSFNNKEPAISKNTAFNKNYEISTSNIKMNNNVSLGILDTIARADHIHPVDTSREPAITVGTVGQYFRGDKTFQTLDKSAVGLNNVVNKDFTQGLNGIIYVSKSGNDSNDGLSLINAYLTINAALNNTYINSGYQLLIYPGTYTENITINKNNLSIVGTNNEIGGIINIAGNITITSSNTSIRLCSLTYLNITYSGTNTNVYLKDCNINGNLTKSTAGYLSMSSCIMGLTSNIIISGSGNVNCLNGCNLGISFLVNNGSAIVNISNCLAMVALQVLSGICSVNDTVLYSINSSIFAVESSAGSIVYLQNLSCVNGNDNTPAKLKLLGFWSVNNVNYNKTLSNLSINNLQREYLFDKVNINNNLTITGNINDTTITELSYLNNVTSDIQTQLNNKIGLSNNNTFTGITTFNNTTSMPELLTNNINNNVAISPINNKSLTNLTTGTYNLCVGPENGQFINQGSYNILLGLGNGDNITSNNGNMLIGRFNDLNNNNIVNSIGIGTNVIVRSSNLIQIGTSNETVEIDGPIKLNNTTTISGSCNLTNSNSTAITQLATDNSTKIATTQFVKYFSAPQKFLSGEVLITDVFTFNHLNFTNSGGALHIGTTSTTNINVFWSSDFVYNVDAGSILNRAGEVTFNNTSAYQVISTTFLNVQQPGRSVSGHIYDNTNKQFYRYTAYMLKTATSILYFVEQLY